MSLKQNITDFEKALKALNELMEELKDTVSPRVYSIMENVGDEWEYHLKPDIDDLIEENTELEGENEKLTKQLEDITDERDELQSELESVKRSLESFANTKY